jgi:psp operon transcriptional activator
LAEPTNIIDALGESDAFVQFQERLSRVASVERPLLIVGERGTGKELAASRLHYLSRRWEGPKISLNCAALAPSLLESELFGHEAGAFTGAIQRRIGRFEAADRGTLFLDEIGLLPMEVQEKILRVVEYKSFERVGGSSPVEIDVRIIGATNVDLPALVKGERFKRDLLDRLSFEVLFLPPLRERRGDISLLAYHFSSRMAQELGRDGVPEFSENVLAEMENYTWPGNIRELKNVVERAVYQADGNRISNIDFDPFALPSSSHYRQSESGAEDAQPTGAEKNKTLEKTVREIELNALRQALERSKYHQGRAAESLGMTYHQFRGLYRKHKDEIGPR